MRVAVAGTGYVGLPTGVILAHLGHQVICVDKDLRKLEMLRKGIAPIYEPGIEEYLRRGIDAGLIQFTDSVEQAGRESDVLFIAVGTPPGEDGSPDLTAVAAVAKELARGIDHPIVVVNKSTVPLGTAQWVTDILLENGAPADLFEVVSSPEFLREGTAVHDALHPDRIVIGSKTREAAQKVADLYTALNTKVLFTDPASAEMIKYAANCFLATKVSFINAISRLCELSGADVTSVAQGVGMDDRIGAKFLNAGLGWGGRCLPKDVSGLIKISEKFGYDFELIKEVERINSDQTVHFMRRIEERLGGLEGKTLGLLGLAFKPNTDDMRDAKSLIMIDFALSKGAKIRAYDPVSMENCRKIYPHITYVDSALSVADGSDVLVLATEWGEFRDLDLSQLAVKLKTKALFDGRRQFTAERVITAGMEYHAVGAAAVWLPSVAR